VVFTYLQFDGRGHRWKCVRSGNGMTLFEYFVFGGMGAVAFLCLIFGVVNWVHLISVSSAAGRIEKEIEKKTAEFDALRKERAAAQAALRSDGNAPVVPPVAATGPGSDRAAGMTDTGSIQIVRNVRGTFDDAQHSHLEETTVDIHPEQQAPGPQAPPPVEEQPAAPPPQKTAVLFVPGIQPAVRYDEPPAPAEQYSEGNVLDIVDSSDAVSAVPPTGAAAPKEGPSEGRTVRIILYSHATKDADFVSAWKTISSALENTPAPTIVLDMSNILFLYEKELGYLEKILQLVTLQKGNLSLVNCENELIGILNKRPSLAVLAAA
jgi:anti-anti-sigma regulatory factor